MPSSSARASSARRARTRSRATACACSCSRRALRRAARRPRGWDTSSSIDDSPAQLALTAFSTAIWRALSPELPPEVEYDPCGTIWIAAEEDELEVVHDEASPVHRARDRERGARSRAQLAGLEPNLRPGLAGGLLVPGDAVLYPPRATHWLLERARATAPRCARAARVDRIGAHAVHSGDDVLHADVIVIAAGAETPRLIAGAADRAEERASRDHRSASRLRATSARGARLPRARAHDDDRVRRVQRAAARGRTGARRVVARAGRLGRVARRRACSRA